MSAGHRIAVFFGESEPVALAYNAQPFALRLTSSIQVLA